MAKGWPIMLVLAGALAASGALAQSGWVDPPAGEPAPPAAPAEPAPAPAAPPRNVEVEPRAAPPAPPTRAETPAPPTRAETPAAPSRAETPPPAPPPARQASPVPPPAPPAQTASPPRPPAPAPDVATRPAPEEPPRRQARPESVEPPAPRQAPPPREPAVAERPAPERPAANLGRAAQQLAVDYLGFWSASNAETLDAMPDFYASRVEFHGRSMSARALFEEKRRFVRRWPDRTYSPRTETMRVSCAPAGEVCTVRTLFDFAATNGRTGRRAAGTGQLELVVALAGPQPVIVSEASRVMRRGQLVPADSADDED